MNYYSGMRVTGKQCARAAMIGRLLRKMVDGEGKELYIHIK
jgi:hypothetical protein